MSRTFFLILAVAAFINSATAFNPKHQDPSPIVQAPEHWEQRRKMMEGGKVKQVADDCQALTQHHSVMASRGSGWLYNHSIGFGGTNGFIDRPTLAYEDREIILIHKWLMDKNRWEKHGAAKSGARQRCINNAIRAKDEVIKIMIKFGAIYVPEKNNWVEGWKK